MTSITINLTSVPSHIDMNQVASQLANIIQETTGMRASVNLKIKDDYSTSPLGIYDIKKEMENRIL